MVMLLRKECAWYAISENRPTLSTPPTTSENVKLQKWIEADEKARALIGLSVSDSQLPQIRNQTSAKESWDALKKFHEQDTLSLHL